MSELPAQRPEADFVPIGHSVIDWDTLLPAAFALIGRSISVSLDKQGYPAAGEAPFIGAIAEFAKQRSLPIQAMRDERLHLRHLHYSFLVAIERDQFFAMSSLGLSVTAAPNADAAVVSGSMREWFHAVRDALRETTDGRLRLLFGKLLLWFERQSLGEVWGNFYKNRLKDGTFILVEKP